MSLTVSPELLSDAERDEVKPEAFIECMRESLPYAFSLIEGMAMRFQRGETEEGKVFLRNVEEPPTEEARGQLLRMMASDAMRSALEKHFSVRLAFQNCHAVGVFPQSAEADQAYETYTSARAQLLNQSPELVNC